ncbi:hypothetical protein U1Q18_036294 [Sarracenia purpurea var. burkii]
MLRAPVPLRFAAHARRSTRLQLRLRYRKLASSNHKLAISPNHNTIGCWLLPLPTTRLSKSVQQCRLRLFDLHRRHWPSPTVVSVSIRCLFDVDLSCHHLDLAVRSRRRSTALRYCSAPPRLPCTVLCNTTDRPHCVTPPLCASLSCAVNHRGPMPLCTVLLRSPQLFALTFTEISSAILPNP